MSAPADYDGASITVDPAALWALAEQVKASRAALSGHVTTIFDTLRGLQTGWNSDSAAEAESFSRLLAASCDDVFGSDGSDGASTGSGSPDGVLNDYLVFLQAAADGFDSAEKALVKSWTQFNTGLTGTGGGGDAGPVTDPTKTAVTWQQTGR